MPKSELAPPLSFLSYLNFVSLLQLQTAPNLACLLPSGLVNPPLPRSLAIWSLCQGLGRPAPWRGLIPIPSISRDTWCPRTTLILSREKGVAWASQVCISDYFCLSSYLPSRRGENKAALDVAKREGRLLDGGKYEIYGVDEETLWERIDHMNDWWKESTWTRLIQRELPDLWLLIYVSISSRLYKRYSLSPVVVTKMEDQLRFQNNVHLSPVIVTKKYESKTMSTLTDWMTKMSNK